MKIVYLLESATGIWGGVKVIFEQANLLHGRGHDVTILSKTPPPDWFDLQCNFETVPDFRPEHIPAADAIVGTFWTTVPFAYQCNKGVPIHFVQGYEGDQSAFAAHKQKIEEIYRLPTHKITISPHLQKLIRDRYQQEATLVRYMIDHETFQPAEPRPPVEGGTVRVGLVGPYDVDWKDIPTGLQACRMAQQAGLSLQLIRVTNTQPHADEQQLPFPTEWHVQVPPKRMGNLYRSMDVFLGTSSGDEEGFFLPAVEAMACGVPTVLTDVPCFRGYGDAPYSLFVEPKDPTSMAEGLVLASKHPRVREELRHHGLETAGRFTPQNHIDDFEQALLNLVRADEQPVDSIGMDEVTELTQQITLSLHTAAEIYLQAGQLDAAIRHLEAAVLVQPEEVAIREALEQVRGLAAASGH